VSLVEATMRITVVASSLGMIWVIKLICAVSAC
jgi:hypothetical protein